MVKHLKENNLCARLLLPTNKGGVIIIPKEIVRAQAIGNYCKIYFTNGKTLVVAKALRWLEEKLPAEKFVRTHRTHLINKNQLLPFSPLNGTKIQLLNGELVDVSRRKRKAILKAIGEAGQNGR